MNMGTIKLLDCTLRDGGYVNQWDFGKETITGILEKLSSSDMDIIECGFLTEKVIDKNYSLYKDAKAINEYICIPNPNTLYVTMIAIGEKEIHPSKLCEAKETFIGGIRLTFHMNEIKKATEWAEILMKKGYKVFMQPVGSANYDDNNILELIKKVNSLKPYAFYIVDTLGTMFQNDVLHMLHIIDKNLDNKIALGYHSHNNLQLSFANAQEMIDFHLKRDMIIDCSVYGMGRGAGNLCTELLIDYMRQKEEKNYDVLPILEIVDDYLMPIYMENPWGYSVAYFLASSCQCHPNYVSYLLSKQTIQVRTISSLLQQLPEENRLIFSQNIIDEIYRKYQDNVIDDEEEIKKLKKEWKGKEILVLAPGKTIRSKKKEIFQYIEKNKPYVIAVNFIPDYPVDMVFVGNQKRYEMIKEKINKEQTVFTSNVKELPESARIVNYSDLLNSAIDISDSSGIMLIKLLVKGKVKKAAVGGLDGFKKNSLENYCDRRFLSQSDYKTVRSKNCQMKEQLKLLKKEIGIRFITPSKYDEE